MQKYYTNKKFI